MTTFKVDTHLFRELGELLVGRDSTALIELIKNAYDADATEVRVYGEALSKPHVGCIKITDNGIGMSRREFEDGFLTIAGRTKDKGKRLSAAFERRYTGQKGVGRLAAHKLARVLEITTTKWSGAVPKNPEDGLPSNHEAVFGKIEWDKVEAEQTLDKVDKTDAITIEDLSQASNTSGTVIELKQLRRKWTPAEHGRFLEELQAFHPAAALVEPLPKNICSQLLFERPHIRDVSGKHGNKFEVHLEGDLSPPEDFWLALVEAAHWVIEIDASRRTPTVEVLVAPTSRTMERLPNAQARKFSLRHPTPKEGPFFQARILKRNGAFQGEENLKQWIGRTSGVRVFMEGFRVLPYGEPGDDWLKLDRDAADRERWTNDKTTPLGRQLTPAESDPNAGLLLLPNKHYVGAVFLTERNAPDLRMLVNREGFIPNQSFETVREVVRGAIDLATRVQAGASTKVRADRSATRKLPDDSSTTFGSLTEMVSSQLREAQSRAANARKHVASGRADLAKPEVEAVLASIDAISQEADAASTERAMFRVLASAGTQLAAFIHEINSLLDMAAVVENSLEKFIRAKGFDSKGRRELSALHRDAGDLRRSLERQASYLIDVVTPDSRRRRSRQSIAQRFETGAKLVASAADRRHIRIINKIPDDLRSPPMFAAELTTVFSNLLSNAVKAAGPKGTIRASGKRRADGTVNLRVENTGAAVRVRDRERFFQPFESTTAEVDTVLGQGMGLGLTITRAMLEEYGARIGFVEPSSGFATAVEIIFPR